METYIKDLISLPEQVNRGDFVLRLTEDRYTYLSFKLHQFISQTGSVYTTLDQGDGRYITLEPGVYRADSDQKKPIFATVFSRISGHQFVCVAKNPNNRRLEPREFCEFGDEEADQTDGYLIVGDDIWDPLVYPVLPMDILGIYVLPCMKWTDNIQRWRGLKAESRREICWRRIPRQVALSMSFEREAVDLSWLEKLHHQAAPPVSSRPLGES